MIEVRGKRL